MNIHEMLGISETELTDFKDKYRKFLGTLTDNQKALLTRSTPNVGTAMKCFVDYYLEEKVTAQDLIELFGQDEEHGRGATTIFCVPTDPGGGGY